MVKMLRILRKEKGISMKALGDCIGVAESTISQYETGKRQPDLETLSKLSDFFGVTTDYLIGRNEETPQLDAEALEIYNTISQLSQENQKRIFDLAKALQSSQQ